MHRTHAVPALGALLVLVACVAPARTFEAYEGKAAETADTVASAVETARLATSTAVRGGVFNPYLSVTLGEAAADASSARSLFGSIQPPDARSDELRARLDRLLDEAEADLIRLRTASRRGDIALLPDLAQPLGEVSRALAQFSKEHS